MSTKIIHSSLLLWRDCYLRKLNNLIQNAQNRRSGEKDNGLFETYKNSVMPHGSHIYATASDMSMDTMFAYPPSQHAFHNGNVCCVVVLIDHVLIFRTGIR